MVKLGANVDMVGGFAELTKAINRTQAEIQAKAEHALKEELEEFAPKLENYLSREFTEFYENAKKSEYYDRTGDITQTIKVGLTQGGGYYGLRLWFDQTELEVIITPKGKFNAHADFKGRPITVEELLGYESFDKKVDFVKEFQKMALDYVNENLPKALKITFGEQRFDILTYELGKYSRR